MNVVLMCSGEIGLRALEVFIDHKDSINTVGVFLTKLEPPLQNVHFDIIQLAEKHGIQHFLVEKYIPEDFWNKHDVDFIFAIKWRLLIDAVILKKIQESLIVFHASLLPRYRGFAPVNWPLINGETKTGVTMFYGIDEVDAGDIIDQKEIVIEDSDNAATLDKKVTAVVVKMLRENLLKLRNGTASRITQDDSEATYAIWRSPEDGQINWNNSSTKILNLIRGLTYPYPGAFTFLEGRKLMIWEAERYDGRRYVGSIPGKVESVIPGVGVNVLTGDGLITLKSIQLDGDSRRPAFEILRRLKIKLG